MLITQATLQALRVSVDTRFQEVFAGVPAWSDRLATPVTVNGPVGVYPFTGDQLTLREWIGPRMSQTVTERLYSLSNIDYEGTLEIPRKAILDDMLGIFEAAIVPGFAEATRKWPDQQIATRIFSANPTAFDGQAYWSSSHPTFNGAGTYDNDHTFELTGLTDYAGFGEALATVRAAAMSIVGESGRILMVDPRTLVVPPKWEIPAMTLANSTVIPTADGSYVDNIWRGMIKEVIVVPELAAIAADTIYLEDLDRSMRPRIWQERTAPTLRSFADGSTELPVRDNSFRWYIDGADGGPYRAAPGVTLPFLSHRIAFTFAT